MSPARPVSTLIHVGHERVSSRQRPVTALRLSAPRQVMAKQRKPMPGTFVSPFRWPQVLMEPERNVAPVLRQPSAVAQTYPGLLQVESELINGHYLWHPFRQGPVAYRGRRALPENALHVLAEYLQRCVYSAGDNGPRRPQRRTVVQPAQAFVKRARGRIFRRIW